MFRNVSVLGLCFGCYVLTIFRNVSVLVYDNVKMSLFWNSIFVMPMFWNVLAYLVLGMVSYNCFGLSVFV